VGVKPDPELQALARLRHARIKFLKRFFGTTMNQLDLPRTFRLDQFDLALRRLNRTGKQAELKALPGALNALSPTPPEQARRKTRHRNLLAERNISTGNPSSHCAKFC
jgi:hypothetical protein